MIRRNDLSAKTDFYKIAHANQYVPNLCHLESYFEMRTGAKYPFGAFFGFSAILQENLTKIILDPEFMQKKTSLWSGGFDYYQKEVWEKVAKLKYLPVKISALPEGSIAPINTALWKIESTQPWFAPFVSSLEGLLTHVWYPSTLLTRELYMYKAIKAKMELTGGEHLLPYALNDFGYRGATSNESAIFAGMAHLLLFDGSDNIAADLAFHDFYKMEETKTQLFSVWATEHSVATSFGLSFENEVSYILHQLHNSPQSSIN